MEIGRIWKGDGISLYSGLFYDDDNGRIMAVLDIWDKKANGILLYSEVF
tara:strand:- start:125 stop:271 length:147 start_codon:yes stop_codon:yes gene_type:complete